MPSKKPRTTPRPRPSQPLPIPRAKARLGKVPAAEGFLRSFGTLAEAFGLPVKVVAACESGADALGKLTDRAHELVEHGAAIVETVTPIVGDAVDAVRSARRKDRP